MHSVTLHGEVTELPRPVPQLAAHGTFPLPITGLLGVITTGVAYMRPARRATSSATSPVISSHNGPQDSK